MGGKYEKSMQRGKENALYHRLFFPSPPSKNVYTKKRTKRGKTSAFLLTDLRYVPVMISFDGELKQKEEKGRVKRSGFLSLFILYECFSYLC